MWRYYGIGEGIEQPCCKVQVKAAAIVLKAFSMTDKKNICFKTLCVIAPSQVVLVCYVLGVVALNLDSNALCFVNVMDSVIMMVLHLDQISQAVFDFQM